MNKSFVKTVLNIYSGIRLLIEPIMFKKFSHKIEYNEKNWNYAKSLSINEFSKYINSFDYLSDKMSGLFDMSFPIDSPSYFFSPIEWGRDCDDFARIWAIYLKEQGWEEITEIIITNYEKPFNKAHVETIAKKQDKYYLFNYEMYGPFNSFEEAVLYNSVWASYPEDKLVWKKYRKYN